PRACGHPEPTVLLEGKRTLLQRSTTRVGRRATTPSVRRGSAFRASRSNVFFRRVPPNKTRSSDTGRGLSIGALPRSTPSGRPTTDESSVKVRRSSVVAISRPLEVIETGGSAGRTALGRLGLSKTNRRPRGRLGD